MNERWEATPRYPGPIATMSEVWRYRRLFGFIGDRAPCGRCTAAPCWDGCGCSSTLFPIALRALIFGGLLGVGSNGLPYFLFLLTGTVVWDVLPRA